MRDDKKTEKKAPISKGRPRGYDEEQVLSKLVHLFWDKGYEATSLTDITTVTGLKKGSLYSLFGGKRDMYIKSLARYHRLYVEIACDNLRDPNRGSAMFRLDEFLSAPIESVIKKQDRTGCFLCNASAEIADKDVDIRNMISQGHDDLEAALEMAIGQHIAGADDKIVRMKARLLLTTYTGLRILARTTENLSILEDAKNAALEF